MIPESSDVDHWLIGITDIVRPPAFPPREVVASAATSISRPHARHHRASVIRTSLLCCEGAPRGSGLGVLPSPQQMPTQPPSVELRSGGVAGVAICATRSLIARLSVLENCIASTSIFSNNRKNDLGCYASVFPMRRVDTRGLRVLKL